MPTLVSTLEYQQRLRAAVSFMEDDLARPFDGVHCGRLAYMAPFHFHAVFKRVVGCAPLEYLRARRLSCAADELLRMPSSVEKVGLQYGYGSQEAFARAFRKQFHVWPSEYRAHGFSLFQQESALLHPQGLPCSSALLQASVQWAPPRTLYGLFLYGENVHADNMRLLYRFLDTGGYGKEGFRWIIADRSIAHQDAGYSFFVGREAGNFRKVPAELASLEIPGRLEMEFGLHGTVDDLHGPFRAKALERALCLQGLRILDSEWKLEQRVGPDLWTRRGYRQNIPVHFRNIDHGISLSE